MPVLKKTPGEFRQGFMRTCLVSLKNTPRDPVLFVVAERMGKIHQEHDVPLRETIWVRACPTRTIHHKIMQLTNADANIRKRTARLQTNLILLNLP